VAPRFMGRRREERTVGDKGDILGIGRTGIAIANLGSSVGAER